MKIFLSAVSDEFRDCRAALASDLRAKGYDVDVQEDFTQHPLTLLRKLEGKIDHSEWVILVVGNGFGYEPPRASVPAGQPRRSYTQWEYAFAMGDRLDGSRARPKDLLVYFADASFVAAHPVEQGAELAAIQEAFRETIRDSGKDRGKFGSLHELCRLVLRDLPAPDKPHHKPVNLPFSTLGTLFKGRDAFLDDLRHRFAGPNGKAQAIVTARAVHGLGGVGKTRAAIEYAWRFADDYSALLFLAAPSAGDLRSRLADLVGVLAIDAAETSVDARLAEVLRWLDDHPGWLLILDNLDTDDDAREAERLLARLTAGHVLITSRIANWGAGVEPLDLHLLPEADAVAFLLDRTAPSRRRAPDDPSIAATIARELDGLALALEQAGAYINKLHLSFAEYLQRWQSKRPDVLSWHDERLMGYPASVAVTWETTVAQLREPERTLLHVLSWFAPDPIPLTLFDAEPLTELVPDPREALAGLTGYSLVRFATEGDAVAVHRLVQEIARRRGSDAERDAALRTALSVVNSLIPSDTFDVRTWDVMTPLAPHAAVIARFADDAGINEPTTRLMIQLSLYLRARGQFAEAEPLMRRALAIRERSYGPDHPDTAAGLNNLGGLLLETGRHAEAEPLMRRALASGERSYGPDHPNAAAGLNNLAGLLKATGRHAEAEPLIRRALAIVERSYGPDHPAVATGLHNLALLLKATGRHAEAEPLIRRALASGERSYGPDHPDVATGLSNLADLLGETGRHAEAEPLMRRALAIVERSYGPDHPDVATRLSSLARLLGETGRHAEAELLMRRALASGERSYGPDHPDVAAGLNNLAGLLSETGRHAEAEPLMRRALALAERSYGPDHPDVAIRLNNLGGLLLETGRHAEAEPLMRRALASDERSYGPDHPDVAIRLNNLANLLQETGRHAEAEPLYRRALAIVERSYGPNHPAVARGLNNLALLLQATGLHAEAEPLFRRAVAIWAGFRRQTGHQHPNFQTGLDNYSVLLKTMGKTPKQIAKAIGTFFPSGPPGSPGPGLDRAVESVPRKGRVRLRDLLLGWIFPQRGGPGLR